MTLFQLCMYTIYANQAIQAVRYFVLTNDTHGIFHFLAPIAYPIGYIMNIQHGEIHRFSELVLRNEKKNVSDSIVLWLTKYFIALSYFVLGNLQLGFQLQEMAYQRETGGPKCGCLLEPNWLSYDSEVKLITLLPGKILKLI